MGGGVRGMGGGVGVMGGGVRGMGGGVPLRGWDRPPPSLPPTAPQSPTLPHTNPASQTSLLSGALLLFPCYPVVIFRSRVLF